MCIMENQKELLESIVMLLREQNIALRDLAERTLPNERSGARRLLSRSEIALKRVEEIAKIPEPPYPNI